MNRRALLRSCIAGAASLAVPAAAKAKPFVVTVTDTRIVNDPMFFANNFQMARWKIVGWTALRLPNRRRVVACGVSRGFLQKTYADTAWQMCVTYQVDHSAKGT